MPTPVDKSRRTRQSLIMAAKETVADRGWSNATSRAIADEADVNVALINYHFDSKTDLLVAALADAAAELTGQPPKDASPSLEAMIDQIMGRLADSVDQTNAAVIFEATVAARHDRVVREAVRGEIAEFRRVLADILASNDVPEPTAGATVLAACIDGLLLHYLVDPDLDVQAARHGLERLTDPSS